MNRQHPLLHSRPRQSYLCLAITLALVPHAYGQTAVPPKPEAAPTAATAKTDIVVLGNPLGATDARDVAAPVSTLSGDALLLNRGNTLGETLNGLLGVTSTWFGPNAGRPVIRGLDGDRVRVLSNLGASLDASSLSFDHNPAIDPLAIERVEVLRGPAALLYGGTAIGGVVNVIDNRIPARPIDAPRGAFEVRGGGADRERSVATVLEAGNQTFALHADAFHRSTDDYRVPNKTNVSSPVVNSSASASGGAMGAAAFFLGGRGSAGISHSRYQSDYGTVAEADVRIDMLQTRTAAELNVSQLGGALVDAFFVKGSRSDYRHTEFEGAEVGTVFKNKGEDFRAELKHARVGAWQGVVGVQREQFDFSALGEEAFVPKTNTHNTGVFILEEVGFGALRISAGVRRESSKVRSDGDTPDTDRFGAPASRQFNITSASVGAVWRLNQALALNANLARNERAPTYYELFANGPHVATAAYEVGDTALRKERANALDVGLKWKAADAGAGLVAFDLSVFQQQFGNFIALTRTGEERFADEGDEEPLPEYQYRSTRARLVGGEAEATVRLINQPLRTWDVQLKLDYVRGEDRDRNAPLARIAPLRVSVRSSYTFAGWQINADVVHAARQGRVPQEEPRGAVGSHTLVGLSALKSFLIGSGKSATFFVRGTNLGNAQAFNAASIDTIRYAAPLPSRSVKVGVRLEY